MKHFMFIVLLVCEAYSLELSLFDCSVCILCASLFIVPTSVC